MRLPTIPKPDTHCFDTDTNKDVWSYSQEQLIAYARKAAESMRDECVIQVLHWNTSLTDRIARDIEALEIET
jgi:hypothetical protein